MPSHVQFGNRSKQFLLGALCALGACWGTAFAQSVSLDNVSPIALTTSNTISAVSINPSTGNVTVRSSVGNYNVCTAPAPVTPVINSFSPTSSTVTPGSAITLNWSSSNTTSCFGSLGGSTTWSSLGTLGVNGSQQLFAPASTGTVTFQLNCTDGTTTTQAQTQVNVQTTGVTCAPTFPVGSVSTWSGLFNTWPSFGSNTRLVPPGGGYLALSFTASAVANQFGTVGSSNYPGDGEGFGQMSISRDPGCFNASLLPQGCLGGVSRSPSVGWINGSIQNRCPLTPGQTYYLNFSYANTAAGASCPGGTCGADVANFAQD